MVELDLIAKIRETVSKKEALGEADVRSLMILIRKLLDLMQQQSDQQSFLITRLFANWAVHIEITKSNTGLRILSAINDALVTFKSADTDALRNGISNEIGFSALRREMKLFLNNTGIDDTIVSDNQVWAVFVNHLIEIIRDVPLSFPPISTLDNAKRNIYDQIARNPIKPGAGVVAIQITNVDYSALGAKDTGEIMCLAISPTFALFSS
ncbi:MAG: hypothetical protein LWX54_01340 [Deltaproteobacteria bacterium]|jgi:hypothetical protein|nr:hypothetical protein [Deltaproteobacteria bacterium]